MGLIWAIIISLLGLVGSIIIGASGRLLSDDVKEWLPWITRRLIERAVSRLPENERQKRREEWESDVNEWPGNLAKLYRAWGYLSASKAINNIVVSNDTTSINETTPQVIVEKIFGSNPLSWKYIIRSLCATTLLWILLFILRNNQPRN